MASLKEQAYDMLMEIQEIDRKREEMQKEFFKLKRDIEKEEQQNG